jgi:aspartate kinase
MLQEMAECGAKVLNAQAVEWARRAGIAIYARASFGRTNKDGEPERQTIVRKFAPKEENRARAIVGENNAARVWLKDTAALDAMDLCESLAAIGIPVRDFTLLDNRVSFMVPLSNVPDWNQARSILETHSLWKKAKVERDVAVVSVVGDGLTDNGNSLRDMVKALTQGGCKPIELRASPLRLRAIVTSDQCAEAQRLLHRAFVEER